MTNGAKLQAGGALSPSRHVYIERPEDARLLELLLSGEYVNVLTSRQMGKSSLMMRTALDLHRRGVRFVTVDLASELGSPANADAYYLGLLGKIARDLKLPVDIASWWGEHGAETVNQRFLRFFREIVAGHIIDPLVVFLDEIDSTLKLPYTDDLFTALRGMYNERGLVETYQRITFCLLGVATPNELIKDRRTTAYNVGETLELRDFDPQRDDLKALARALAEDEDTGRRLLDRVLHWTGGHPFLTVRICIDLQALGAATPKDVDHHVDATFIKLDRLSNEVHFQQILRFVETRLTDDLATLDLYGRVLRGARERDQTSLAHAELKLSGLVKRDHEGVLVVRNALYQRLFDATWVDSTKPKRTVVRTRRFALAASIALMIAIGSGVTYQTLVVTPTREKLLDETRVALKEAEETRKQAQEAARPNADDFLIVDCQLPGQVRRLGTKVTYVSRRPTVRTSMRDCKIRGGEYVAYDNATHETPLTAWLPDAEGGDAKAQTYVGEIYEKGLGGAVNYVEAARWYRKAAEQGYAPAQISLGHLYEAGLGVTKDQDEALAWYSKATGDKVVPANEGEEWETQLEHLRQENEQLRQESARLEQLRQESARLEAERNKLRGEIATARGLSARDQASLEHNTQEAAVKQAEMARLQAHLEEEIMARQRRLAQLAPVRGPAGVAPSLTPSSSPPPLPAEWRDIDFRSYYALVIGNDDYQRFPRLETAATDAREIARLLESKYGFRVAMLINATRYDILRELNAMRESLTEKDSLLIYYAGYCEIDRRNQRGYWLPIDAEPDNTGNWISNVSITDIIKAMSARHVMVVGDLCYSGLLTRSALARLESGMSSEARLKWIRSMVESSSRTALTSGGAAPVVDSGGGKHSIFAQALIEVLSDNRDILEAQRLFNEVSSRVISAASKYGLDQVPKYGPIQYSDHGGGDFFFVPRDTMPNRKLELGRLLDLGQTGLQTAEEEAQRRAAAEETPRKTEEEAAGKAKEDGATLATEVDPGSFAPGEIFTDCDVCPEMVVVPIGSFTMGSPLYEPERSSDEGPLHRVAFVQPFAVSRYEITFAEWDACVDAKGCNGYRPADRGWGRGQRPVINVNWNDAQEYVKWLSDRTGKDYRLLREAEWEYAARAGTTTPFYFGGTINPEQANYNGDYTYNGGPRGVYREKTMAAGSFPANAFGLHDVHGNLWEWVADCYEEDAYKTHKVYPAMVGSWQDSCSRVVRGGSWNNNPKHLRSADRDWYVPDYRSNNLGFRVARAL